MPRTDVAAVFVVADEPSWVSFFLLLPWVEAHVIESIVLRVEGLRIEGRDLRKYHGGV